jgi:hypothetical protein
VLGDLHDRQAALAEQGDDAFGGQAGDRQRLAVAGGHRRTGVGQQGHGLRASGRSHPDLILGRRGQEVAHAGVGDQPAATDDDEVVGGVFELAHQVAGDEHGAALGGERTQEAADPADPVGVQPVDRLVEQEHRGVAQHGAGDAQPLQHAQGEPAGASPRGRGQPHQLEHFVDPSTGEAVGLGHPEQVVPRPPARVDRGGIQQRADVEQRCP